MLWKPANDFGALTKELEAFQRPTMNHHAALIAFASLLRRVVRKFASHGFSADLNSTYLLRIAQDKLPNPLKLYEPNILLKTTGQIKVSLSFSIGWIRTNNRVQVPSTIGRKTKIVRISQEVKALTPAINALKLIVQQIETLVMQKLSSGWITVATTQKDAFLSLFQSRL